MNALTEAQPSPVPNLSEALPGSGREESPVVVSQADLTFEQSEAVQILIGALRPTVVIIAASPAAPGAVLARFGRADSDEGRGSTLFMVLDSRGELVSVTLGMVRDLPAAFVESDETDAALGVNLRGVLARARHA